MLRSIAIGFAIAALLQVGALTAMTTRDLVMTPSVKMLSLEGGSALLLQLIFAGCDLQVR